MIGEYDPLHGGHVRLMEEARRICGPGTPIVVCMSGCFVQRGAFAVTRPQARARAAVESGADLVLGLPLPWSVSSAEGFAQGAVGILAACGVVDHLVFGSEGGDTEAVRHAAAVLEDPRFPDALREELRRGDPFPAARQRAVERLSDRETAAVLSRPNDLLGVEYCKALSRLGSDIRPVAVRRLGTGHGAEGVEAGALPSSSAIRALLRSGEREAALSLMAPAMREAYREEEAAGRAPVSAEVLERAVLARLRSMGADDFAALDEGHEGLCDRFRRAVPGAVSVREVLDRAKTRRYPMARLRRMTLWAFLGIRPGDRPPAPPYLRPLAMSRAGRALLSRMRERASLPILSRAGTVRRLGEDARRIFDLEVRAAGLYALAYPDLSASGDLPWADRPWTAP